MPHLQYVGDQGFIGSFQYGQCSSTQTYTNNTTVATVPGMTIPVLANAVYKAKYQIIYAGNGGDIKINWTVPSGAAFKGGINDLATTSTNTFGVHRLDALANIFSANLLFGDIQDTNDIVLAQIEGIVTISSTPGDIVMTAAQSVSSGNSTTLNTGTNCMYWRVA